MKQNNIILLLLLVFGCQVNPILASSENTESEKNNSSISKIKEIPKDIKARREINSPSKKPLVFLPSSSPPKLSTDKEKNKIFQGTPLTQLSVNILEIRAKSIVIRWEPLQKAQHYSINIVDHETRQTTNVIHSLKDLKPNTAYRVILKAFSQKELIAKSEFEVKTSPHKKNSGKRSSRKSSTLPSAPPFPGPVVTPVPETITALVSTEIEWPILVEQNLTFNPDNNQLIFSTGSGHIVAVDSNSHEIIWETELDYLPSTGPVIGANGEIYIGTEGGYLYRLNETGEITWHSQIDSQINIAGVTLSAEQDKLFLTSNYGGLYAVRTNDYYAENIWYRPLTTGFENEAIVSQDNQVLVGDVDNTWYSLDAENGDLLWQYNGKKGETFAPAVDERNFYLSSRNQGLYSLSSRGLLNWRFPEEASSSPLIDQDNNIYFTGKQTVYCLDPFGAVNWSYELPEEIEAAKMLLDESNYLYLTASNSLKIFSPEGWLIQESELEEQIVGGITIDTDSVLHLLGISGRLRTFTANDLLSASIWPKSGGNLRNTNIQTGFSR